MVVAENAYFIRLGKGNCWASTCLADGTLRLDYREIPHSLCESDNWEEVLRIKLADSGSRRAAVSHKNQIQQFYKAHEGTLWITFHADRLHWCFSKPEVSLCSDSTKIRNTIGGWHDTDTNGKLLLKSSLSGKLLAVEGFRGTICSVPGIDYLLNKINGTFDPHVIEAQNAFENIQTALIPLIRRLHYTDLETLTDLIFRHSGWQRVGVSGGIEKDIDLDLLSPVTGERIAVQVKSRLNEATWHDYCNRFADMRGFSRFYFVTHSPNKGLRRAVAETNDPNFIFWDENKLAWYAARCGLIGWLLDKAA